MPSLPELLHHLEKWRAHLEEKSTFINFYSRTTRDPRILSVLRDVESRVSPFATTCIQAEYAYLKEREECRYDHQNHSTSICYVIKYED